MMHLGIFSSIRIVLMTIASSRWICGRKNGGDVNEYSRTS